MVLIFTQNIVVFNNLILWFICLSISKIYQKQTEILDPNENTIGQENHAQLLSYHGMIVVVRWALNEAS